jgi:hypothetical protein
LICYPEPHLNPYLFLKELVPAMKIDVDSRTLPWLLIGVFLSQASGKIVSIFE